MTKKNFISFIEEGYPQYYLLFVLMILVPAYYWYVTPVMIVLGLIFAFSAKRKYIEISFLPKTTKILFFTWIIFYLWQVLGLAYSESLSEGVRNITLRLPLLLFPLILISPDRKVIANTDKLLKVFAISTFLFVVFCFAYATYRAVSLTGGEFTFNPHPVIDPWLNFFYESHFAIFQHPSYLSMYILFSVFISFEYLLYESNSILKKIFSIIVISVLLISIYLLSSRAALITIVVCVPAYFIFNLVFGKLRRIWWVGLIIVTAVMMFFIITNPRINKLVKTQDVSDIVKKSKNEVRIGLWQAGMNIFLNNIFVGVGTGDVQQALDEQYESMRRKDLVAVKQLNVHNQFIEIAAEHGLMGLSLFVLIFIIMVIIALKQKNVLYIMFIIIATISLIFETMLNRLAGLSFISVFSFLLIHIKSLNVREKQ